MNPADPINRLLSTGLCSVSEYRNLWIKGRILSHPDQPAFELSFEDWESIHVNRAHHLLIHPSLPITYLSLQSGPRNLAEFWVGRWLTVPPPDLHQHLANMLKPLMGYQPFVSFQQARFHASYSSATSGTSSYVVL